MSLAWSSAGFNPAEGAVVDRAVSSLSQPSVRALIAELAQVEDALRSVQTYISADDGATNLNPELLSMLDREREIVLALRSLDLREIDLRESSSH